MARETLWQGKRLFNGNVVAREAFVHGSCFNSSTYFTPLPFLTSTHPFGTPQHCPLAAPFTLPPFPSSPVRMRPTSPLQSPWNTTSARPGLHTPYLPPSEVVLQAVAKRAENSRAKTAGSILGRGGLV